MRRCQDSGRFNGRGGGGREQPSQRKGMRTLLHGMRMPRTHVVTELRAFWLPKRAPSREFWVWWRRRNPERMRFGDYIGSLTVPPPGGQVRRPAPDYTNSGPILDLRNQARNLMGNSSDCTSSHNANTQRKEEATLQPTSRGPRARKKAPSCRPERGLLQSDRPGKSQVQVCLSKIITASLAVESSRFGCLPPASSFSAKWVPAM